MAMDWTMLQEVAEKARRYLTAPPALTRLRRDRPWPHRNSRATSPVHVASFYFNKSRNLVDHQPVPVLDEEPVQCRSFWKLLQELRVVVPPQQKIPLVHSIVVLQECSQDKQRF